MKKARPEVLAVRAVNQYRRRDVLAYVGLRYYLGNCCSVRDRWATEVATHLVLARSAKPYFRVLHFKDYKPNATLEHRDIHIPGPNEALAEAVLLQACGEAGIGGDFFDRVFSYRLAESGNKAGMFQRYFKGFRERHEAVVEACRKCPGGVVLYTDIQRFYPSISSELALKIWAAECDRTRLEAAARQLGEKMLSDHASLRVPKCAGLLTGPMLSHLIGNLILREADSAMSAALPGGYFRYVDDIILVGAQQAVESARTRLKALLEERGLRLHETGKDFRVNTSEWLEGADDFKDDGRRPSWATVIGGVKHLLTARPNQRDALIQAFRSEGIRLPVPDYSEAVWETPRLQRFAELARYAWFRRRLRRITVYDLVREALVLRERHTSSLCEMADGVQFLTEFQRKRRISKLKYHAARLVYVAAHFDLPSLGDILRPIPELRFYSEVLTAIGTEDVSELVSFGTNAVQSAAQPLRMLGRPVRCVPERWGEAERQGIAILLLNGITLAKQCSNAVALLDDELNQFARWDGSGPNLMKSSDAFIRELACLHGHRPDGRHVSVLDTAFDRDEEIALDAISQVNVTS